MTHQRFFIFLATFFLLPVFVFAEAPTRDTPAQTASSTLIASSTPTTDTAALIQQLQALIVSLQTQINELKAKLETTQQEVAVVKSEVQFITFLAKGAQGDEVRQLQELLAQDQDLYPEGTITGFFGPATEAAVKRFQEKHGIEARGVIGPKTRAKLNELITQGAGKSGMIPPGLVRSSEIQRESEGTSTPSLASTTPSNAISLTATTTASTATTSLAILCVKDAKYCASQEACTGANFFWYTVSCHKDPPPVYSCAASYNYCVSPTECAAQGWYACRNSCYPSVDACQGQAYVAPAQPTVPAPTPILTVSPTSSSATTSATSTTPTIPSSAYPYGSALNLNNVSGIFEKIWGPGSNGIILGGGLNFSTQVGVGWAQQYGGKYVTSYSVQGVSSNYITQASSVNVAVTGPAGSIIEVWDLETLTVTATNISSPGSPTVFTAQPNHRYGGFGWYSDNAQKNIEIHAALSSSSPAPDSTPPVISGIQATSITATATVITWTTDEAADSQVEYGLTTSYGSQTALDANRVTSHSAALSGFTASTLYHYRVKSKDAAGNQAASADYTLTTLALAPAGSLAPTNIQAVTTSSSQSQPPQMWYYMSFDYTLQSTTQSFNVYRKRSTDASFVKYIYSAQTPVNGSILPLPGSGESNLYHRYTNQWQWWTVLPTPAPDTAVGEYKFYVTAVDTSGGESVPSETKSFKLYAAPAITSPADGSTVSAPFTITVTGDPSASYYGMVLYKKITGDTAWSVWPAPSKSFTYSGLALSPSDNPHRLAVWYTSGNDSSLFGTSVFNISTTTSSLDDIRAKNLAAIAQTLNAIREKLIKLLQGL